MTFNTLIRRRVKVDSTLKLGEFADRTDRSVRIPAAEFFEFYTANTHYRLEWFKKWFDVKMAHTENAVVMCQRMELDPTSWIIDIGVESDD